MVPHPPIIIPQIGRGEERLIQASIDAYEDTASRIAALKPQLDGGNQTVWETDPAWLAERAQKEAASGCIGGAYTYNELLIGWEFVRDNAREVRKRGMKNVVVTNGSDTREEIRELSSWVASISRDKVYERHGLRPKIYYLFLKRL